MPQNQNSPRIPRSALSVVTGPKRRRAASGTLILILLLLLVFAVATSASAEDSEPSSPPHITAVDIEESASDGSSPVYNAELTDSEAAKTLPRQDLDREQALELMERVFEPLLQAPAGIFDELEVERFLSNNAAIIAPGDLPQPNGTTIGAPPSERYEGAVLLESTMPLRTESDSGQSEAVDLDLEHAEGEVRPANPLVEVGIPQHLGEGIELPEVGVQLNVADAPSDRTPSTVAESVAAYPEVAKNTSLAVAPTARGVETLTMLQAPDAPTSQTLNLSLPTGAVLESTREGGAKVVQSGAPLLGFSAPTAVDASGAEVPVTLSVSGASITLEVSPEASTAWPVLVDPIIETYNWWNGITGLGGWSGWTNAAPTYYLDNHDHCDPFASPYSCQTGETSNAPGLFIGALPGAVATGNTANWEFLVPRFQEEWTHHKAYPESFIASMALEHVGFWHRSDSAPNPTLWMGIWNPRTPGWVSGWPVGGNSPDVQGGGVFNFSAGLNKEGKTNTEGKIAAFNLSNTDGHSLSAFRDAFVNTAVVSIADTDLPNIGSVIAPSHWVNQIPSEPITVTASDLGLGVYRLKVSAENVPQSATWPVQTRPCTGTTINPCEGEHTFALTKHTGGGGEVRDYDPSVMPQGADNVLLTAEDPLGNKSKVKAAEVYVDHTPPKLSISGSATEQGGTNAAQYSLQYRATDGDIASPVSMTSFGTSGSGPGQMLEPKGIAVDPSGNFWVVDRGNHRVMEYDRNGNYLMQFGSSGTGNGKFTDPRGIAIAPNGTIWITDEGNNNVQAFSSSGQYLRTITNASFEDPYGVAVGPGGVVWVSDITSDKLFEFNENATFIRTATTKDNKQHSVPAEMKSATGLATDPAGDIWLVDYVENRVQKYNANGEFLFQFGTKGTGEGQLEAPIGVAVAPSGDILVTNSGDNHVEIFQADGHFLRQLGTTGSGTGQLSTPVGIAVGEGNRAYVVDSVNHRVARWEHADLDRQSGVVRTEVKVDGKLVEEHAPGCATESCSLSYEHIFKANEFSSGKHTVKVTATDGVELSAPPKEFTFTADNTAPELTATNKFFTAPKGWLEQKGYYYTPIATDAGGSGVTSLILRIDGSVVKSAEQQCPNGGCSEEPTGVVSMNTFKGGAHQAELIATDVAGNVAKKTWTINVDPKGEISAGEATDTIEASDETAGSTIVSPNGEEEREIGNDPVIEEAPGGGYIVNGVPTKTEMPEDPSSPITVPSPEGSIEIDPVSTPGTGDPAVANESALVDPNTDNNVDSVVRPIFDGFLVFADIRSSEAPENYSWEVLMGKGQSLVQIDEWDAEVRNANGSSAVSIRAQPAHDATGKELPTSIKVEGTNVVTLTVQHKVAGVVYPVVGGPGFEVGYETASAYIPSAEEGGGEDSSSDEAFSAKELANGDWIIIEGGATIVGAPEAAASSETQTSGVWVPPITVTRPFKSPGCLKLFLDEEVTGPFHPHEHADECNESQHLMARGWAHGHFHYELEPNQRVWWEGGREEHISCDPDFFHNASWHIWPKECQFSGENNQKGGGSTHIVARHFWRVETENPVLNEFGFQVVCVPMYVDLYSNGNVSKAKRWGSDGSAFKYIGFGEACPWPV